MNLSASIDRRSLGAYRVFQPRKSSFNAEARRSQRESKSCCEHEDHHSGGNRFSIFSFAILRVLRVSAFNRRFWVQA